MNQVRELAPIRHKDAYTRAVERHVLAYFDETIFGPLVAMLDADRVPADKANAKESAVIAGIKVGRIWYTEGVFSGSFSAAISKELREMGATFDARASVFRISPDSLPNNLRGVLSDSIQNAATVHHNVEEFLLAAEAHIKLASTGIELDQTLGMIRGDLWRQMERSVKGIDWISVPADLTPEISAELVRDFTQNLDLYVKNFLNHEIPELRQLVEQNAFAGGRPDKLRGIIEARYGVTKRKAAFLADQESSLFVSKFREARYKAIGAQQYQWSTSHDERVRPDHRVLNGKIFSWDNPPITNKKTGAHNNPGEDFRCRCVAIPILNVPGYENARKEFRCAAS